MDVHVRDLRYFIAVAEELHFRKAAERLFVSQPVLSRQIARLETMVQARLLERDHRLVRLTPAGEYLLGRARMLLAEWDETGAELARLGKLHASTLIVGLQTGVGRGLTGRLAAGLGGGVAAGGPEYSVVGSAGWGGHERVRCGFRLVGGNYGPAVRPCGGGGGAGHDCGEQRPPAGRAP